MIGSATLLFKLAGIGSAVKKGVSAAFKWVVANPWPALAALGLAVALFQTWRLSSATEGQKRAVAAYRAETGAHRQTVANYEAARKVFAAAQRDNVKRVVAQQRKNDETVIETLKADRDRADAGYRRLREQAATYRRSAASNPVPTDPDATCRAYAGTDCAELPARLKAAQDQTDQLVRLQEWAKKQASIKTSPAIETAEATQ